jgi:hypothetical protein
MGLFRTPSKTEAHRCVTLAFPPHLKSNITNHLALTHGRVRIPTSLQRSDERHLMGLIRTPWNVMSYVRA